MQTDIASRPTCNCVFHKLGVPCRNLPELDRTEKELVLQYIHTNNSWRKVRAIGIYRSRNNVDLLAASNKIEAYIKAYLMFDVTGA